MCRSKVMSVTATLTAVQASVSKIAILDASVYTKSPPCIWGSWPRLARQLAVQRLTLRVESSQSDGLMVSGRLQDATADGFPGETGNFIRCATRLG